MMVVQPWVKDKVVAKSVNYQIKRTGWPDKSCTIIFKFLPASLLVSWYW